MSYVYIRSEPQLWTVGFYRPDGRWEPDSDHASQTTAADRVHYLNGGTSPAWEQVPDTDAIDLIGEGVHTGLRKGRALDSPASDRIWKAIADDASDEAWSAALEYAVDGLRVGGYALCKAHPGNPA